MLLVTILTTSAFASTNSGVSYQGRILKPDGTPLSGVNTQFKMQIRTPDSAGCLMYEEIQQQDLSHSNGAFSLTVNDGTGTRTDSTGLTLDKIFANHGSFALDATTCTTGTGTYAPGPGDGRALVVLFKDETMSTWEPIPAQKINFVPFAFEAKQVAGITPASLVRVIESDGTLDSVSPLSNVQYNALVALANGSSTAYTQAGTLNGSALPTMSSGQVLGWNGSAWVSEQIGSTQIANSAVSTSQLSSSLTINTSGTVGAAVTTTRDFKIYAASPSTYAIDMQAPALTASYSLVWPMNAGTNGQVLTTDGSGNLSWGAGGTSSQWTSHASNISYDGGGNVGIGTTAPNSALDLGGGTLSLYGASGANVSATSAGNLTINSAGGGLSLNYGGGTKMLIANDVSVSSFGLSNMIKFSNGATEAMRITNGNVGIGTTSPSAKLDVAGTINASAITINGQALSASQASQSATGAFTFNSNSDSSGADGGFSFQAGGSPLMTISNGGQVGVTATTASTSTSTGALTVAGGVGVSGALNVGGAATFSANPTTQVDDSTAYTPTSTTVAAPLGAATVVSNTDAASSTGSFVKFQTNNAARSSYIGAISNGATTPESLVFGQQTGTTAYSERMRVDSSGFVGIGTTAPQVTADIDGTLSIGGAGTGAGSTTLSAAISSSQTTVPVVSTAGFPSSGQIALFAEIMSYTSKDATNFYGVRRGLGGMSAVGHASGSRVDGYLISSRGYQSQGFNFFVNNTGVLSLGQAQNYGLVTSSTTGIMAGVNTDVGNNSVAAGNGAMATGQSSIAVGDSVQASGINSHGFGTSLAASAYGDTAIGRYNVGGGTAGSWVATDPLFEIGNGTGTGVNAANALTVLKNGKVGLGTATPGSALEVDAWDPAINGSAVAINTHPTASSSAGGIANSTVLDGGSNTNFAMLNNSIITGNSFGGTYFYGTLNTFNFGGTGGIANEMVGTESIFNINSGSGTFNSVAGTKSLINLQGGATISNATGHYVSVTKSAGTIANGYGLYIDAIAGSNHWGIYQAGANDPNYFAGFVGIGTTAPTARLALAGGTATAGTAPLKFAGGVLLTTPEDGAMEYASSNLYYTIGTTRYVIPLNTASGNYSNVSTISNTSGSITMSPMAGNSVIVNSTTVSTSSTTGALVVNGGEGVAGAINASGNITSGGSITATTSAYIPQLYGSNTASGSIKIDGTSNATPGNIYLASAGGSVGIGTTAPSAALTIGTNSTSSGQFTVDLNGNAVSQGQWGGNFTAHEVGTSYGNGIMFLAQTDASNTTNSFFVGKSAGTTNFSVRADGQGYFAGSVGIGTTAPATLLDVAGSVSTPHIYGGSAAGASLQLEATSNATTGAVQLNPNGGLVTAGHIVGSSVAEFQIFSDLDTALRLQPTGLGQGLSMGTTLHGNAYGWIQAGQLSNSSTNELALNPLGGNVGVQTRTPNNPLSVSPVTETGGSFSQSGHIIDDSSGSVSWTSALVGSQFLADWGDAGIITAVNSPTELVVTSSRTQFSFNHEIHTLGLQVTSSGNVGIGTTAPSAMLQVTGGSLVVTPPADNTTATIDFTKGNVQTSSYSGATTIKVCGLKDGGQYNAILTGFSTGTTITLQAYTDAACSTPTNLDFGGSGSGYTSTFTTSNHTSMISIVYVANRGVAYATATTNFYH